jgi:hypothetical protein
MQDKPYFINTSTGGETYELYKSLCGIKEPISQAYGKLEPTCKKCIQIEKSRSKNERHPKRPF